jgi:hypothetical protein
MGVRERGRGPNRKVGGRQERRIRRGQVGPEDQESGERGREQKRRRRALGGGREAESVEGRGAQGWGVSARVSAASKGVPCASLSAVTVSAAVGETRSVAMASSPWKTAVAMALAPGGAPQSLRMWRAGLRIHEALALGEADLDERRGALLARRGKGSRAVRSAWTTGRGSSFGPGSIQSGHRYMTAWRPALRHPAGAVAYYARLVVERRRPANHRRFPRRRRHGVHAVTGDSAPRSPATGRRAACSDRFEPGSVGPDSVATPEASCRRSDRAHAGSEPEPARPPGVAELLLLGGVLARRVVSLRRCCRAAEEVHFDPADQPVPELGVADAPPFVRRR